MNDDEVTREGEERTGAPGAPAAQMEGEHQMARARIEGRSGSDLSGEATLMQQGDALNITVRLENAPPGSLAVHIHEHGDCSAPDSSAAGEHWNPTGAQHGRRGSDSYHLGDLDNIEVGSDGTGSVTIAVQDINLDATGDHSALGKSIVVHSGADDFQTQPDGAAGERIGCGVLERDTTTHTPGRTP